MAGPTLFQVRRTSVAGREANTTYLPTAGEIGVNLTDGRMWVANTTNVFEVGANCNVSHITTSLAIGNSSVNITSNSTQINATYIQLATAAYVGDNVDITTAGLIIGNTTVNLVANSVSVKISNSTVNTAVPLPTVGQYGGAFYLHANGTWATVSAAAGGANTQVQFNDSSALGGSAGHTFDKATNNSFLANTLTVGTATVNSTLAALSALNVTNQINTATLMSTGLANLNALNVTNQVNAATVVATTSMGVGNTVQNTTAFGITGNTTTAPTLVLTSNSSTSILYGNSSITGAPTITVQNSTTNAVLTSLDVKLGGTATVANTLGVYTGIVNAATHSVGTAFTANATLVNAAAINITGQVNTATFNSTGAAAVGTTLSAGNTTVTGFVNATVSVNSALHSVGATFTANATLVNAAAINITGQVNTATFNSTGAAAVGTTLSAGNTTITGFANATVSVNSALLAVGALFTANSTLVNAAAINVTGQTNTVTFFATTSANVGANVQANTTAFGITGNTTTAPSLAISTNSTAAIVYGNSSITGAPSILLQNSVSSANHTSAGFFVGTSVVNTLVHAAGANVIANTTAVLVGNSIINTIHGNAGLTIANSTVSFNVNLPTAAQNTAGNYFLGSNSTWQPAGGGGAIATKNYQTFTATAGQTAFVLTNTFANTLVDVYYNGVHLANTEFTANSAANTVTLGAAANLNAVVEVSAYSNATVSSFIAIPGGANNSIQFNDSLVLNGTAGFIFDKTTNNITIANSFYIGAGAANVIASSVMVQVANSTFTANLGPSLLAVTNVSATNITAANTVVVGGSSMNSTSLVSAGSIISANIQINAQTDNYTLVAADSGKIVSVANASSKTLTVPAALPIGFRCQVLRLGAGAVVISNTGQSGCTILSRTTAFTILSQYGSASVLQTATANTYIIDGLI